MKREPRVKYAVAGGATRLGYDRIWRERVTFEQHRVYDAVVYLVASWSRVEDRTSIPWIAHLVYGLDHPDDVVRWQRKRTGEALRALAELGIITYRSELGPGAECWVGLPVQVAPVEKMGPLSCAKGTQAGGPFTGDIDKNDTEYVYERPPACGQCLDGWVVHHHDGQVSAALCRCQEIRP